MATHTRDELRAAAGALGHAALKAGFRPAAGPPVTATLRVACANRRFARA